MLTFAEERVSDILFFCTGHQRCVSESIADLLFTSGLLLSSCKEIAFTLDKVYNVFFKLINYALIIQTK